MRKDDPMIHGDRVALEALQYSGVKGRTGVARFKRRPTGGQLVLVTGPNGAGKTTMLQAIQLALLGYEPVSGKQAASDFRSADDMRVSLSCADGWFVSRVWKGDKQTASAWGGASGVRPVDAACLAKFGQLARVLDVNAWHAMTPREKFEALLSASKETGTVATLLGDDGESVRGAMRRLGFVETGNLAEDVRAGAAMLEDLAKESTARATQLGVELDALPGDSLHVEPAEADEAAGKADRLEREARAARERLSVMVAKNAAHRTWRDRCNFRAGWIADRRAELERSEAHLRRCEEAQRRLDAAQAALAKVCAVFADDRPHKLSRRAEAKRFLEQAESALAKAQESYDAQDWSGVDALREARDLIRRVENMAVGAIEADDLFRSVHERLEAVRGCLPDQAAALAAVEARKRELQAARDGFDGADRAWNDAVAAYDAHKLATEKERAEYAEANAECNREAWWQPPAVAKADVERKRRALEEVEKREPEPDAVTHDDVQAAENAVRAANDASDAAVRELAALRLRHEQFAKRQHLVRERQESDDRAAMYRRVASALRTKAKAVIDRAMAPLAEASARLLQPINPQYEVRLVDGSFHAVQKDGRLVPWRMLSGGERVVFDAALMAALFAAFDATWRPYLMDATALDTDGLQAVLDAAPALASSFDFVLLTTCHADVDVPEAWQTFTLPEDADAG